MSVHHLFNQEPTTIPTFSLSDYMRLEGYDLPSDWSWMVDAFQRATGSENPGDLMRYAPQDVGSLIDGFAYTRKTGGQRRPH